MAQSNHSDRAGTATESKFYLPVGLAPVAANHLERIWVAIFRRHV